jgi:hypothetical protein
MEPVASTAAPPVASRGRWLGVLGVGLLLGGVIAYMVQFFVLGRLTTPWYAPILGTLAVLLMIAAFVERPTVARGLGAVLIGLLCAAEWYFLLVIAAVPAYAGPAQAGMAAPAFTTTVADGRAFTDADLRQGTPTVLLFFRGRW